MRTSCRWNLLTHTSSLLVLHCSWCVIVIYAVGIAVYFIISVVIAVFDRRCCRFRISCIIAVVVHIAVITLIAAIAIYVLLPLLPLSMLSALCTHPPGYTLRFPVGV